MLLQQPNIIDLDAERARRVAASIASTGSLSGAIAQAWNDERHDMLGELLRERQELAEAALPMLKANRLRAEAAEMNAKADATEAEGREYAVSAEVRRAQGPISADMALQFQNMADARFRVAETLRSTSLQLQVEALGIEFALTVPAEPVVASVPDLIA